MLIHCLLFIMLKLKSFKKIVCVNEKNESKVNSIHSSD